MHVIHLLLRPNEKHLAMACFDAYQDGALSEEQKVAYDRHLQTCQECQTWVDTHSRIAQILRVEAPRPATLSAAATARLQRNLSLRMRQALIMSNVKSALASALALAVLVLVIGTFVWQSGDLTAPRPTAEVAPQSVAAYSLTEEGLIRAIRAKDSDAIERILNAGVSPDVSDYSSDPVLKLAIQSRSPRIVALLVAHGADVNIPDSHGNALLPQAARMGNLAMVQTLVEAGADLEGTLISSATVLGVWEATALNWAALDNRIEIARYLIQEGADVNAGDPGYQRTPLHSAAWSNNDRMVTLLLESGADPDALSTYSSDGRPIHFAIESGSVEAIAALLAGGATVDIQSETGQTPLMYVQVLGLSGVRERIVTLLLEAGADPNLRNDIGNTALHLAVRWDRIDVIPILVEYGASLDAQNLRGETPLDVAVDERIVDLLNELRGDP